MTVYRAIVEREKLSSFIRVGTGAGIRPLLRRTIAAQHESRIIMLMFQVSSTCLDTNNQ
jgi:hypothetical protein